MFLLAFGESLAFISLLLPAWAALVGIGVLIASGDLSFWPVWVAASVGAALGDWLSYWIGLKLGPPVAHLAAVAPSGPAPEGRSIREALGAGRDLHRPLLRAIAGFRPAGRRHLPDALWEFQAANFSSAFVWAAVLLTIGDVVTKIFQWIWG